MHTALTRANALAAYTMSVLASLTFLCFLSTFFNEYQVHADINTVKVVVKNVPDYAAGKEKNDLGFLTFDLQVRFWCIFDKYLVHEIKHNHWNTNNAMKLQ